MKTLRRNIIKITGISIAGLSVLVLSWVVIPSLVVTQIKAKDSFADKLISESAPNEIRAKRSHFIPIRNSNYIPADLYLRTGQDGMPVTILHTLFNDQLANDLKENPMRATREGVHDYDYLLASVTPKDYARRLKQDRVYIERLKAIDRELLLTEDQLNYDMFEFYLRHRIALAKFRPWRVPLLSDDGFHISMTHWARTSAPQTVKDYENYIERLNAIPTFFEQNMANMRLGMKESFTMPHEIFEGIEIVNKGQLWKSPEETPFFRPFTEFSANIDSLNRQRLTLIGRTAIEERVIPAYAAFEIFFAGTYKTAARKTIGATALPNGEAYYDALVKFFTTINVTADELHKIGLMEVARIRDKMDTIIKEVGFEGSFAEFIAFLRSDPQFYAKTPKELLAEASYIAKQADGKLPAYFGKLPRQPYSVQPVPAELAPNYTGGRYSPAPLDGPKGGEYWVNTYALDKRPLYVLTALSLHEAVPGHHLQVALVKELPEVPAFRRDMRSHAFDEGWALYSEKLGVEMGLYKTPYDRFGQLTYEMWRACRLVVDTGLHAKGWTRSQAREYLASNSAMSLREVMTEVDRYVAWPGQALAFKTGEMKIFELRARATERLGDKFDIREFHDTLHKNGSVPLEILEQEVEKYITDALDN